MRQISEHERDKLFDNFKQSALHLEMRDIYSADEEKERFASWLRGAEPDEQADAEWWRPWYEFMAERNTHGRTFQRLRIISEPVTQYIRFEWSETRHLIRAGEKVRWLPRQAASKLMLPGNDFWLFDTETVVFTHFSGDGQALGYEMTNEPVIVQTSALSFAQAWAIATPHEQYEPS